MTAYRPDLLEQLGIYMSTTWDAVLSLAKALMVQGEAQIAIPLMHVDCAPTFISLCNSLGEAPMQSREYYVSRAIGREVLHRMCTLLEVAHPASIRLNPPQLLDLMSRTDEIVYCPLLFGYSNYARSGYRPKLIQFANIPLNTDGAPAGSILGGAGLAVSSSTLHRIAACEYASYVASPIAQRTTYVEQEGQPGYRSAWLDTAANIRCANFFTETLATLDHAYMRPRYQGYIQLQDRTCEVLYRFLADGNSAESTLHELDRLYRLSLQE